MKNKDCGVVRIEIETPKYAVSCLICDKTIGVYDYPISSIQVCEDCRNFCLPMTRPPQSWCYVGRGD